MAGELKAVDWTDERTADLKEFLLSHKLAMLHCDESLANEYGLCECMQRLAEWWVREKGFQVTESTGETKGDNS